MKKIIFILIFSMFLLNQTFGNFEDIFFENKQKLEANLKKETEENYVKNCLYFGKYFFGKQNNKNICFIMYTLLKIYKQNTNKIKILEIAFGGDIMLSRSVGARNKKFGYDRIFKNFYPNKDFSKNTILFYNLESPFLEKDNDIDVRSFIFKSNPKNIAVLNELKGENQMILSLANNHITNAGGAGIDTTIDILDENNIKYLGVSREEPKIKNIISSDVKTCFSAYTYDGQIFYSKDKNSKVQKYFINKIDKNKIFSDLEEMKQQNCDFKIISIHWGTEYKIKASKNQKNLAHEIIDNGADLILGHHSHIPGEIEEYNGKMIYYSLGNFIFDQDWGKNINEYGFDYIFDEKLNKKTVPTYIGNTFYHKYKITGKKIDLISIKNIKHRINFGELNKY